MYRWLLRVHPVDLALGTLLSIATVCNSLTTASEEIHRLLLTHASLLTAFLIFTLAAAKWSHKPWVLFVRPICAVATIYTLYTTLGRLALLMRIPSYDSLLSRIDTWIGGGTNPTLYIQQWQTPAVIAFFAVVYGLFIPYINLSIILGTLGRPPLERDKFLTGWIFVYAISYLGYLIVPAAGPIAFHAADYTTVLEGSRIYDTVAGVINKSGGAIGAFPSLHVGSSLYLCLFDLRTHRLRGLTYLPLVILIYFSTVFLRYHYVIDLIVGTLISLLCLWLGPWTFEKWARARESAGLAALPGREGDVLSGVPNIGDNDTQAVLPAD